MEVIGLLVMGKELFDHAFKTYSKRWMFKHPTPEDFFRTMEDASAVDLDWFWRGWFYSTDYVDIGVKEVKKYRISSKPSPEVDKILSAYGMTANDLAPNYVFMSSDSDESNSDNESSNSINNSIPLKKYLEENPEDYDLNKNSLPKNFYEIEFEKPGGLVMPIIVDYIFKDGTKKRVEYPVQVWRKNDDSVKKVLATNKELVAIKVDPDLKTADIDISNNSWPKEKSASDFEKFKNKIKG